MYILQNFSDVCVFTLKYHQYLDTYAHIFWIYPECSFLQFSKLLLIFLLEEKLS